MGNVSALGSYGDISGSPLMFRNKLINGGFDIWQRGTSQTSSGYGSDDRWDNANSGSTKTASRQAFTVGQTDVPNNPRYWARTVVTSVAGSGNYAGKTQRIESVITLSGQTATLSFWAKADAAKNMAVEFVQSFGTGGSPSSIVTTIGVSTVSLTTSWQKFVVNVSIPSISGKTLGTNGDDYFSLNFWFDAGSSLNARTNSLGQQSGTFDIANVQLEAGSSATPFEQRPVGMELNLCQRYYEKWLFSDQYSQICVGQAYSTTVAFFFITYLVQKRSIPILTASSAGFDITKAGSSITGQTIDEYYRPTLWTARLRITTSGLTAGDCLTLGGTSTSSYIDISSEIA